VTKGLHEEHETHSHDLDKQLAKGDAYVARFISGAAVGALAGSAFTAGSGIVPGAVVGGLVTAVIPKAWSSLNKSSNGQHDS
jgi:hypothetical protein